MQHLGAVALAFDSRDVAKLSPDHQRDDLRHRCVGSRKRVDGLAVAHNGDTVGDGLHLIHLMGDVNDADVMRLQVSDDVEHVLNLGFVERRSGLVHHEHLRVEGQGFGDLNQLLPGDREVAHFHGRANRDIHSLKQCGGGGVLLRLVDEHSKGAPRLTTNENVLRRGHMVHQKQFLMDNADAEFLRGAGSPNCDRFALNNDLARVGLDDFRQDLHQRRLAGAVFSHQRMNLAGAQIQARAAKGFHAWE